MTADQHVDKINNLILDYGHAIQYMGPNVTERPFAYTVGRTLRQRPELLISAPFPPEMMMRTLNEAVLIDDATPLVPNVQVEVNKVKFVAVECSTLPLVSLLATFGPKVTALQLVWPDDNGFYPWQLDYSLPPESQPIYRKEA